MTCASSRRIFTAAVFLLAGILLPAGRAAAAAGENGGTQSNFISGNSILDLYYSAKDSNLFVLTGSGLSYCKWLNGKQNPTWYNFGPQTFQPNFWFSSVAAGNGTVFVVGYTHKTEGYSGGNIYFKSKGEPAFHTFYPHFNDNDSTYLKLPYDVHIQNDSLAYVSLFTGTMLKTRIPPSLQDTAWKAVLVQPATLQSLIIDDSLLIAQIRNLRDSLVFFRTTLGLTDSTLLARTKALFTADSLVKRTTTVHYHRIKGTGDTATLEWQTFRLDTTYALRKDTLRLKSPVSLFASVIDTVRDSVVLKSIAALTGFIDTLGRKYDTVVSEINANLYPPAGYPFKYSIQILSINGTGNLLLAGGSGGLMASTDSNRTFKDVLSTRGSPLFIEHPDSAVSHIKDVFINKQAGQDSFRVWVLTTGDTIAYSGSLPNTDLNPVSHALKAEDSLRKWTIMDSLRNVSDIAFFKDTVFVSYSQMLDVGLKKFYQIDTVVMNPLRDTVREWRSRDISLKGLLEPQLGCSTIVAIPIDSQRYELWAGTPDGLYRLQYGSDAWDYFEYKRPFESIHGETYAYPTVIRPGFKSAKIAYHLDQNASVTIDVFDFSMRKVRTLVNNQPRLAGFRSDNSLEDRWDGRDGTGKAVTPGVYYYRISAGSKTILGKIVVFGAKDF